MTEEKVVELIVYTEEIGNINAQEERNRQVINIKHEVNTWDLPYHNDDGSSMSFVGNLKPLDAQQDLFLDANRNEAGGLKHARVNRRVS